jgi:hypothetical protein
VIKKKTKKKKFPDMSGDGKVTMKDTVSIKYATVADAKKTIRKVKKINKPYARKIQILTVIEQRSKYGGKPEQARLAKKAKLALKKKHGTRKKSKKS